MIYLYELVKGNSGAELISSSLVSRGDYKMNNVAEVYHFANKFLGISSLMEEHIYMFALNSKNKVEGVFLINKGTGNTSMCNIAGIMTRLLLLGTQRFIMIHNHPSGDCTPSSQDDTMTVTISKTAELLGLDFLDHVIIGDSYYSYANAGKMK